MTKENFKLVYDQFFDSIRNYLYFRSGDSDLATDIAQEVFLKIWEKQIDYNPQKIKPLLYKIAGDLFVNFTRRQKVESNYLTEIKFNFKNEYFANKVEFEELKQIYENVLAILPENQRLVFVMSRMENLKYREIAERLQISVKTVEKRMSLALAELKKALKQ